MPKLNEVISHLYYTEKLSANEVAQKINRDKSFVLGRLRKMQGPRTIHEGTILRTTPEYREKIRQTKLGDRNHQAKLTESDVLAIREAYIKLQGTFNKSQAQYILADEYGVKRPTISDVVLRKTWKHI